MQVIHRAAAALPMVTDAFLDQVYKETGYRGACFFVGADHTDSAGTSANFLV